MIKFDVVKKFKDIDIDLIPKRATANSAGYDFVAAEDTVVPSYFKLIETMKNNMPTNELMTMEEIAALTKSLKTKPTLVSTGVKCYMEPDIFLQLSVRSSGPLKHWILEANSVGIIDADYADNEDNEGEIFFQLINLSPFDILIKKGEKIGQGILIPYLTTDDDEATGKRTGGFGSTSSK